MFLRRRIVFIRDVALEPILKLSWDCHNARQGKGEHFMKKRRLSARECAILQTFPMNYEFVGSLNRVYTQIGNAVPVKLARLISGGINDILMNN